MEVARPHRHVHDQARERRDVPGVLLAVWGGGVGRNARAMTGLMTMVLCNGCWARGVGRGPWQQDIRPWVAVFKPPHPNPTTLRTTLFGDTLRQTASWITCFAR